MTHPKCIKNNEAFALEGRVVSQPKSAGEDPGVIGNESISGGKKENLSPTVHEAI